MLAEQRQETIMRILSRDHFAEVEQLSSELGVSLMTIRRDLQKLNERGLIHRQHGGASLPGIVRDEREYSMKQSDHPDVKRQLARTAVKMINDGDTIFLDSGTTTFEIARLLVEKKRLTVVTNDIPIAGELLKSDLDLIVIGGMVQNKTGSVIGSSAVDAIRKFRLTTAFVAAPAVDNQWDVLTPTIEKAYLKRAVIAVARRSYLVVDASKFGKISINTICNLSDISGVITDKSFSYDEQIDLRKRKIVLIHCEQTAAKNKNSK